MGTKANPGRYDCYANAKPNEPIFILLGRDRRAPQRVEDWASEAERAGEKPLKVAEARACAASMRSYRANLDAAMPSLDETLWWSLGDGLFSLGEFFMNLLPFNHAANICACWRCEELRLGPDGLSPYRARGGDPLQCEHVDDDRVPISGDGWLCASCGDLVPAPGNVMVDDLAPHSKTYTLEPLVCLTCGSYPCCCVAAPDDPLRDAPPDLVCDVCWRNPCRCLSRL